MTSTNLTQRSRLYSVIDSLMRGGLVVEMVRAEADIVVITATEAVLKRRDGTGSRYVYRDDLPEDMVPLWDAR